MPDAKSKVQGNEPTFELHTLGWKAFQSLGGTIASEVLGQTVQVFSPTNDAGRDNAFRGEWSRQAHETWSGSFTLQCKHFNDASARLSFASIKNEVGKAKVLATQGNADVYIVLTNARISGVADQKLRAEFSAATGIQHVTFFGYEWLCEKLRESPKLRMLVPRVYGLGDLSQILDERAYEQAQAVLQLIGPDLRKFVLTESYTKAARAIIERGFVLLLGQPAAGKSTIAATLAVGASDVFGCTL